MIWRPGTNNYSGLTHTHTTPHPYPPLLSSFSIDWRSLSAPPPLVMTPNHTPLPTQTLNVICTWFYVVEMGMMVGGLGFKQ